MNNWFENNPIKSIITYTIFIIGVTWLSFTFIVDDNKANLYKAQTETYKAQSEAYKAKIDIIESQNTILAEQNQIYLEWLQNSPNTIPFFEFKLKNLESQKTALEKKLTALGQDKPNQANTTYSFTKDDLTKGQTFIDPYTGVTLGVSNIYANLDAIITLTLPGQNTEVLYNIKPGMTWQFDQFGKKFKIIITQINWYTNSFNVTVSEIKQ